MDRYTNVKNIDSFYDAFVIGSAALYITIKTNEAIGYLMVVEVSWGNLLTEVMDCNTIKQSGYLMVR